MRIIILRHGQAQSIAASDAERALTPHGEEQARDAGRWLAGQGVLPGRILVSPLRRAQQTAGFAVTAWGVPPVLETVSWLTPETGAAKACRMLGELPDEAVLLVSHQPLVSALAGFLVNGAGSGIPFDTATVAVLEADPPARGCAQLLQLRHAVDAAHP